MATIVGILTACVYILKILAWFVPLFCFLRAVRELETAGRLTALQSRLGVGFGLCVGILLRWADTRSFIGVGLTESKFEVGFFDAERFWHSTYFAFWSYWVNPLDYPFGDAVATIAGMPYLAAAAALLLIAYCAVAARTIDRANRNNAVAMIVLTLLAPLAGFYAVYWFTWLWAVLILIAAFLTWTMFRSRVSRQSRLPRFD